MSEKRKIFPEDELTLDEDAATADDTLHDKDESLDIFRKTIEEECEEDVALFGEIDKAYKNAKAKTNERPIEVQVPSDLSSARGEGKREIKDDSIENLFDDLDSEES